MQNDLKTHKWSSDLLSMDDKSLAIGYPLGAIKIYNRNNLKLEKVLQVHTLI